jgi:hypothetical protein
MVPWRSWQIRFAKGSLKANLLTGEIFRVDLDGVERLVFKASDDERDSAARSQISSFMSVNHSSSNLKQSHFVMMTIDAIRRSANTKESVVIVRDYGSM